MELEVWLNPDLAKDISNGHIHQRIIVCTDTPPANGVRAKLNIEIQEPKIEITPSMIEQAWKDAEWGDGVDNFRANIINILFRKKP